MSVCCIFVDIFVIFVIFSEICFVNVFEGVIGVYILSFVIWIIMIFIIIFVNIII